MREHSRSSPLQAQVHRLWVRPGLLRSIHELLRPIAPTLAAAFATPILLFTLACGSGNGAPEATPVPSPTPSPAPTPSPTPTPTPTPVPFDPTAVLERSGKAMQDLESFRFELTHNEGGTEFIPALVVEEALGEVVKPDRLSLKFSGTFGGSYAIKSTLVSVGGTTYMTNPLTGTWQEMDDTVSPLGFFNPTVGIAAMMLQLEEPQEVETDRDDVHRLTGTLPAAALSPLLGSCHTGRVRGRGPDNRRGAPLPARSHSVRAGHRVGRRGDSPHHRAAGLRRAYRNRGARVAAVANGSP